MFQHTATRRWLQGRPVNTLVFSIVSTHSHPKVAAYYVTFQIDRSIVSTHSHPKVAASHDLGVGEFDEVSTHSHPKVAADKDPEMIIAVLGFNTQPPEGGCEVERICGINKPVSTHSHPKVAAS